jgi:hypothetical protein
LITALGIVIFVVLFPGRLDAQVAADTLKPPDSVVVHTDSTGDELVLETIEIKGRVEKPGVIILPKRVEPTMKEVELDRSFQQEVKEGVGEIPKPEEALGKVERIESIKKTVGRKRK